MDEGKDLAEIKKREMLNTIAAGTRSMDEKDVN